MCRSLKNRRYQAFRFTPLTPALPAPIGSWPQTLSPAHGAPKPTFNGGGSISLANLLPTWESSRPRRFAGPKAVGICPSMGDSPWGRAMDRLELTAVEHVGWLKTAPTQARCHSEADLREAAKLSTSRRQNSDHGGPCSIRSRRRSASRRHLSRPSVSCFTDAEKNASLACASSLIERDCSTSMRKRFISMSSSFSSRRMTGNGSGASQGWGPRKGLMMTTFAAALIW